MFPWWGRSSCIFALFLEIFGIMLREFRIDDVIVIVKESFYSLWTILLYLSGSLYVLVKLPSLGYWTVKSL